MLLMLTKYSLGVKGQIIISSFGINLSAMYQKLMAKQTLKNKHFDDKMNTLTNAY